MRSTSILHCTASRPAFAFFCWLSSWRECMTKSASIDSIQHAWLTAPRCLPHHHQSLHVTAIDQRSFINCSGKYSLLAKKLTEPRLGFALSVHFSKSGFSAYFFSRQIRISAFYPDFCAGPYIGPYIPFNNCKWHRRCRPTDENWTAIMPKRSGSCVLNCPYAGWLDLSERRTSKRADSDWCATAVSTFLTVFFAY